VYFISTIISGDDGQGVIGHPCRTSHQLHISFDDFPVYSRVQLATGTGVSPLKMGDLFLQVDVLCGVGIRLFRKFVLLI
jgi:hypothetical protein